MNNPGILNYGFQVGSGVSGVQTIPVSDFDLYFEVTNRVNCPVKRYELWSINGSMYLPTDIQLDAGFNIEISTADMKQTMLNIKGYTESGVSALLGLLIEVCGLEIIQLQADIF
jgi:hypothetical protein